MTVSAASDVHFDPYEVGLIADPCPMSRRLREEPPRTLIFEDPPIHDIHRKLLSRIFTPAQSQCT